MKSILRNSALLVASLLLCAGCTDEEKYTTVDGTMLGTTCHLVARTSLPAERLRGMLLAADAEAKGSMSIFSPESRLSRINAGATDSLDCHIARNLAVAARIHAISGGAYDVTVKPLTDAYGFAARERDDRPNIDSIVQFVGFDKLRIVGNRIEKADPRVQIDLNSIAKGYTVELVAGRLEAEGITDYIIEVGGEIRARGKNPRGMPWRVGIDTPVEGNDTPGALRATTVNISGGALATSGNYRRYFVDAGGEKVVHTIDPRSGRSARSRLLSATVLAGDCTHADALATMFMAVGERRAVELAEAMRDSVRVYFILAPQSGAEPDDFEIFSTVSQD